MTDDGTGNLTGNYLPEDPDTADALRLAEVLERVESGRAPTSTRPRIPPSRTCSSLPCASAPTWAP